MRNTPKSNNQPPESQQDIMIMRVIFELLVEANLIALASFAPNLILILACMNVCTRTTGILPGVQFSEYAWLLGAQRTWEASQLQKHNNITNA